ncbi:MAG TPA: AMP-binding protein [Acidimicrobiales bacterium]|jgi:acyl-CoA synthetase (AMP-forming)/AMP-acid ligase II/acyl carrier protein|nr:AMP-binding protein [Acidimicrobiales bacterium]
MTDSVSIIPDLLRQRRAEAPDVTALVVDGGPTLTYREWDDRANAVAHGLVAAGVRPGDPVALVFDNAHWTDYAVAYAGVLKAGGAAVPLGPRFAGPELLQVVRHSGATAVISGRPLGIDPTVASMSLAAVESGGDVTPIQAGREPDDVAEILYTSGTTGVPKGVACSHRGLLFHDPPPEPEPSGDGRASFVHAFPIGTNAGQEVLRVPLRRSDRTAIALPAFDPNRYCALIAEHGVRRLQLVPAMAQLIVASAATDGHDVSSVERVILSSAPSSPALLAALAKAFPSAALWNTYALTEAGTARTLLVDATSRPESVGRPVGGTELLIVDDQAAPVATGTPGEIWIRRPGAPTRFYYRDPEATAATFGPDGWVHTGDVGYVDDEGYLYLVDRKKDLIIVGGLNVSSVEVENVLLEHPAVGEAAVFAVPHPVLGQDVAAAVVALSPVSPGGLQGFVRSRLGEHKVPHRLFLVDELPRTATGKVSKYQLREQYRAAPAAAPVVTPRDELEATVVAIWESVLDHRPISVDADFFDLGGHSLAATQIMARLEAATGTALALATIFESPTPAGLATAVRQRQTAGEDPLP